ncbi:MAG: hypothetical protein NT028_09335 [candidate division Zixibacteria bacterium]|nr:hypothetical protein [candidate division Zixibacteria bacterium]
MLRSYHFVDPTTVALILRSGIVLFLKLACCLWILFGGGALLIEFLGRRASWFSRAHRIAGDTRLTTHQTGWLLRRILAPMLAALLLLSGAASGNDQVIQKPLSRSVAADWSGTCTLVPIVVGLLGRAAIHKNNHDISVAAGLLCVGGLVVGPATGHTYARQYDRCLGGTLARCASVTLMLSYLHSDQHGPAAAPIAAVGVFVFLVSFGYDIGTVGRSVDKYKHSYGFSDVRIAPTYFASHKAPGVMLTLSF